jgi:hypothetical protein
MPHFSNPRIISRVRTCAAIRVFLSLACVWFRPGQFLSQAASAVGGRTDRARLYAEGSGRQRFELSEQRGQWVVVFFLYQGDW